MALEIEILPDAESVAERGAEFVARQAAAAVADGGRFTFAVSGGHTPWAMFATCIAPVIVVKMQRKNQTTRIVADF